MVYPRADDVRKFAALAAVFVNRTWADIRAWGFWRSKRALTACYLVNVPGPNQACVALDQRLQPVVLTSS